MIKPTPTLLPPPGTPYFTIPSSYSLWASTDYAIQSWHLLGTPGTAIQAIILVVMIVAGLYILIHFLRDFVQKDANK